MVYYGMPADGVPDTQMKGKRAKMEKGKKRERDRTISRRRRNKSDPNVGRRSGCSKVNSQVNLPVNRCGYHFKT